MRKKFNRKRLITWLSGFAILFLIDLLVESILLPMWGLDNTPKNDIYFKLWWLIFVLWLVFGIPYLLFNKNK